MLAADATAVLSVIAPRALRHGGPIEMRPDSDALSGPALPLAVRLDTPRPKCKSAATRVMSARKRANAVRAGENQASRKRLAGTRFDIFGLGHVYAPAAARRRYPDLFGPYALTRGARKESEVTPDEVAMPRYRGGSAPGGGWRVTRLVASYVKLGRTASFVTLRFHFLKFKVVVTELAEASRS